MRVIIFIHISLLILSVTPKVAPARDSESLGAERAARNLRYNGGTCDLTRVSGGQICFFSQYEPRSLPLIPTKSSAIVGVGNVVHKQCFLSADRTHVYTEVTLTLDEIFKSQKDLSRPSRRLLTVDRMGGELFEESGGVLRDKTRSGFMGDLRVGSRYVFFANYIHKGKDVEIVMAYEIRGGKVYKLSEEGVPGGENLLSSTANGADGSSSEQSFLQAVRRSVEEKRRY